MLGRCCSLKRCVSVCPGDEGRLPAAPLPPLLALHLGPPPARPLVRVEADEDGGEGTGAVPEAAHGQEGAPGPTPEAEEETEELDPGEDGTGRVHGPMSGTGTETGTGGATQHADGQGTASSVCLEGTLVLQPWLLWPAVLYFV